MMFTHYWHLAWQLSLIAQYCCKTQMFNYYFVKSTKCACNHQCFNQNPNLRELVDDSSSKNRAFSFIMVNISKFESLLHFMALIECSFWFDTNCGGQTKLVMIWLLCWSPSMYLDKKRKHEKNYHLHFVSSSIE